MTAPLVVTDTDLREALDAWAAMRDQRDEAQAKVRRVEAILRGIGQGLYATKGRDYGRGVAFAAELVDLALRDGLS